MLSRCLQFSLKTAADSADHRASGAPRRTGESSNSNRRALRLLARAADGSMRDALSLLDQAIAFGGGAVLEADVRVMLGTIDQSQVFGMLRALAALDGRRLLEALADAAERAPDFEALLAELLTRLQQVAVAQALPDALGDEVDDRDAIMELAGQLTAEDVQLFYQIGLIGRRDLPLAPDPRGGLEMILLRMLAFRPLDAGRAGRAAAAAASRPSTPAPGKAPPPTGARPETSAAASTPQPGAAAGRTDDWSALVECLPLKGMLRELAMNCACERKTNDDWVLSLSGAHRNLLSDARLHQLSSAIGDAMGHAVRIRIEIAAESTDSPAAQRQRESEARRLRAVADIESDPNIEAIQKAFDATLHTDSIRPLD